MQPKTHSWLVCTVVALCTFAITLKAQPASAEVAYAVTETNKLIRFDTGQAGQTDLGTITGTIGGEQILSIDFRPLTGRLYGVSANRLYTIDPVTAQAQPVSGHAVRRAARRQRRHGFRPGERIDSRGDGHQPEPADRSGRPA